MTGNNIKEKTKHKRNRKSRNNFLIKPRKIICGVTKINMKNTGRQKKKDTNEISLKKAEKK